MIVNILFAVLCIINEVASTTIPQPQPLDTPNWVPTPPPDSATTTPTAEPPETTTEINWGTPLPDSGIDLGYVPFKLYTQVRKSNTVKFLPAKDAVSAATGEEVDPVEIANAPRLKETIKVKKVNEVYTEQGYHDTAYDHKGHSEFGEHHDKYEDNTSTKYRGKGKSHASGSGSSDGEAAATSFGKAKNKTQKNGDSAVQETRPITYDNNKYPFYRTPKTHLPLLSPQRISSNSKDIPKKTEGNYEFYESRDSVHCPEVIDKFVVIPKDRKTPILPRLSGLGDKIDCLKTKYFGQDPLDNPFFQESPSTIVSAVSTPTANKSPQDSFGFYSDIVENIRSFGSDHSKKIPFQLSESRPVSLLGSKINVFGEVPSFDFFSSARFQSQPQTSPPLYSEESRKVFNYMLMSDENQYHKTDDVVSGIESQKQIDHIHESNQRSLPNAWTSSTGLLPSAIKQGQRDVTFENSEIIAEETNSKNNDGSSPILSFTSIPERNGVPKKQRNDVSRQSRSRQRSGTNTRSRSVTSLRNNSRPSGKVLTDGKSNSVKLSEEPSEVEIEKGNNRFLETPEQNDDLVRKKPDTSSDRLFANYIGKYILEEALLNPVTYASDEQIVQDLQAETNGQRPQYRGKNTKSNSNFRTVSRELENNTPYLNSGSDDNFSRLSNIQVNNEVRAHNRANRKGHVASRKSTSGRNVNSGSSTETTTVAVSPLRDSFEKNVDNANQKGYQPVRNSRRRGKSNSNKISPNNYSTTAAVESLSTLKNSPSDNTGIADTILAKGGRFENPTFGQETKYPEDHTVGYQVEHKLVTKEETLITRFAPSGTDDAPPEVNVIKDIKSQHVHTKLQDDPEAEGTYTQLMLSEDATYPKDLNAFAPVSRHEIQNQRRANQYQRLPSRTSTRTSDNNVLQRTVNQRIPSNRKYSSSYSTEKLPTNIYQTRNQYSNQQENVKDGRNIDRFSQKDHNDGYEVVEVTGEKPFTGYPRHSESSLSSIQTEPRGRTTGGRSRSFSDLAKEKTMQNQRSRNQPAQPSRRTNTSRRQGTRTFESDTTERENYPEGYDGHLAPTINNMKEPNDNIAGIAPNVYSEGRNQFPTTDDLRDELSLTSETSRKTFNDVRSKSRQNNYSSRRTPSATEASRDTSSDVRLQSNLPRRTSVDLRNQNSRDLNSRSDELLRRNGKTDLVSNTGRRNQKVDNIIKQGSTTFTSSSSSQERGPLSDITTNRNTNQGREPSRQSRNKSDSISSRRTTGTSRNSFGSAQDVQKNAILGGMDGRSQITPEEEERESRRYSGRNRQSNTAPLAEVNDQITKKLKTPLDDKSLQEENVEKDKNSENDTFKKYLMSLLNDDDISTELIRKIGKSIPNLQATERNRDKISAASSVGARHMPGVQTIYHDDHSQIVLREPNSPRYFYAFEMEEQTADVNPTKALGGEERDSVPGRSIERSQTRTRGDINRSTTRSSSRSSGRSLSGRAGGTNAKSEDDQERLSDDVKTVSRTNLARTSSGVNRGSSRTSSTMNRGTTGRSNNEDLRTRNSERASDMETRGRSNSRQLDWRNSRSNAKAVNQLIEGDDSTKWVVDEPDGQVNQGDILVNLGREEADCVTPNSCLSENIMVRDDSLKVKNSKLGSSGGSVDNQDWRSLPATRRTSDRVASTGRSEERRQELTNSEVNSDTSVRWTSGRQSSNRRGNRRF